MDENKLKEYLLKEWRFNNHIKYLGRFEEWYGNITEDQKMYYMAYADGKKTPYCVIED